MQKKSNFVLKRVIFLILFLICQSNVSSKDMILDQLKNPKLTNQSQQWTFFTDQVMGGLSTGKFLVDKVDGIMTSHVVNSKIDDDMLPATLSEKSINKLLREFLDYKGVVFSDDMQMGAITRNFGLKESLIYAINAGVDVLIFSNNQVYKDLVYPEEVINIIEDGVRNGEVSLLRINESFRRIQNLKKKINLIN